MLPVEVFPLDTIVDLPVEYFIRLMGDAIKLIALKRMCEGRHHDFNLIGFAVSERQVYYSTAYSLDTEPPSTIFSTFSPFWRRPIKDCTISQFKRILRYLNRKEA